MFLIIVLTPDLFIGLSAYMIVDAYRHTWYAILQSDIRYVKGIRGRLVIEIDKSVKYRKWVQTEFL